MKKFNYVKRLSVLLCGIAMAIAVNANAQWDSVGPGCSSGQVESIMGFNGNVLFGGGYFYPYENLSSWNGSKFSAPLVSVGLNNVLAITTFDSVMYVAADNVIYQQVNTSVNKIATLGKNDNVRALCFWNHKLYVGGHFDTINGHKYNFIATYNGSRWDSVMSVGDTNGMTSDVYAFCPYNGQLAVGGYFWYGGGTLLDCVGLWDGNGHWTRLGHGMYDPAGGYEVLALATMGGNLFAGGYLDSANGVKVTGLAQWDGSKWDSVGSRKGGISNTVYALTPFNGGMVAGGYFDSIMFWNGAAWSMLGGPLANYSEVEAMTVYNNILYVGGQLTKIGALNIQNVAQYSVPLGINELADGDGQLLVYPNPSHGIFNFKMSNREQGISNVEVYNMLGQTVANGQWQSANSSMQIDFSNQTAGIYLYRVTAADGTVIGTGKLIVQ